MRLDCIHEPQGLKRLWQTWRGHAPRGAAAAVGVLAAVVAVAWLLRPGPQTSDAQGLSTAAAVDLPEARTQPAPGKKDLPVVPGRHDRIHRDFFRLPLDGGPSVQTGPEHASDGPAGEVPVSSQEVLKQGLRLKAIMVGTRPRALINDVFVSVGEKVQLIAGGPNDDEFEVAAIDDQTVSLTRGGEVIVLRLESEVKGHSGGARLSP